MNGQIFQIGPTLPKANPTISPWHNHADGPLGPKNLGPTWWPKPKAQILKSSLAEYTGRTQQYVVRTRLMAYMLRVLACTPSILPS